jgi:hypothetical protein
MIYGNRDSSQISFVDFSNQSGYYKLAVPFWIFIKTKKINQEVYRFRLFFEIVPLIDE